MTIISPSALKLTLFEDGQAAGSITPGDVREMIDSLVGITENTQTASYILVLTDAGMCVEMNSGSPNSLQIPTNASVAFDVGTVIGVYQMGVGQTTIVAVTPATTTLRLPTGAATLRAQYSTAVIRKRATDEWVLSGDLT